MARPPLSLPDSASIAEPMADGRMHAPSAARNLDPILQVLAAYVPAQGYALELASGTGEHIVGYARAFAGIGWQPTDIAPERLASIDAWRAHTGLANLHPARMLDAAAPDWALQAGAPGLVVVANLFHLIPQEDAAAVIAGVARALAPGGRFFVYGPFRSNGAFRSDGDAQFHASLSGQDARIGYKDEEWMAGQGGEAGMPLSARHEMPANNLALVFAKPEAAA